MAMATISAAISAAIAAADKNTATEIPIGAHGDGCARAIDVASPDVEGTQEQIGLTAPAAMSMAEVMAHKGAAATDVDHGGAALSNIVELAAANAEAGVIRQGAIAPSAVELVAVDSTGPERLPDADTVPAANAPKPVARCKRHRLCSRGGSHPGQCKLPPPRGRVATGSRQASTSFQVGAGGVTGVDATMTDQHAVSNSFAIGGVAQWLIDELAAEGPPSDGVSDAMAGTQRAAEERRRIEASTLGLDASQCERHPLCIRGYKHGGRGGHCALPAGISSSSAPNISAKRSRHLRLLEINSGRDAMLPIAPDVAEAAAHQAARERRRASGKRVAFAEALVTYAPTPPPLSPVMSDDEEEGSSGSKKRAEPRRLSDIDASFIIDMPRSGRGAGGTTHRPLRSNMQPIQPPPPHHLPMGTAITRNAPVRPESETLHRRQSGGDSSGSSSDGGGRGGSGRSDRCGAMGSKRGTPQVTGQPCERDPLCVRGFRHCGWGGRCSYRPAFAPSGVTASSTCTVFDSAASAAAIKLRTKDGDRSKGLRLDPAAAEATGRCERNAQCTRGFKHQGWGGHCRLAPSIPPDVSHMESAGRDSGQLATGSEVAVSDRKMDMQADGNEEEEEGVNDDDEDYGDDGMEVATMHALEVDMEEAQTEDEGQESVFLLDEVECYSTGVDFATGDALQRDGVLEDGDEDEMEKDADDTEDGDDRVAIGEEYVDREEQFFHADEEPEETGLCSK